MKIRMAVLPILVFCSSVFGDEFKIDLKLNDLKLNKYEYTPAVDESERLYFKYGNEVRSYFVYVPRTASKEMPVVVALHGAGRSGSSMVDTLRNCSNKYQFVVVAPNGEGNNWDVKVDDSSFIREAIKDALNKKGLKAAQMYLFGHSNGARKAIALAALYPGEYKAVAAHAGTLTGMVTSPIINQAVAKPRIGLFLGDKDHIFSIGSARETAGWFERNGYPTSLFIMQNHSHWYYEDFDRINESVWAFLSKD
ncbi:MAG TPA: alpha/beta hydrolase-fold protein [Pseudomonas sp.]|nr:alpha/beta hydrolase-fold protein [Pseudomonas sp.]